MTLVETGGVFWVIRVQNNRLRWDYWTYKSVVSSHNKGYNKQEFQGKQKVAEEESNLVICQDSF